MSDILTDDQVQRMLNDTLTREQDEVSFAADLCCHIKALAASHAALREMFIAQAKTFNAENAGLAMLLARKEEALGVFADTNMWDCRTKDLWIWDGDTAYANPKEFARREMLNQFPSDSIGSVTHTMEEPK